MKSPLGLCRVLCWDIGVCYLGLGLGSLVKLVPWQTRSSGLNSARLGGAWKGQDLCLWQPGWLQSIGLLHCGVAHLAGCTASIGVG